MVAKLLISPSLQLKQEEINKLLKQATLQKSHPDVLYIGRDEKVGIAESRKIKNFFSLKPYQSKGRAVVLEDATILTLEAQNALLKTLEELPKEALFILGADSEAKFLPTVLSRCEIVQIKSAGQSINSETDSLTHRYTDIENLLKSSLAQRFEYIEKLKDKEQFLHALVSYFHKKMPLNSEFTKELLQAEEWQNQNVNIRAILEYLMLKLENAKP